MWPPILAANATDQTSVLSPVDEVKSRPGVLAAHRESRLRYERRISLKAGREIREQER